MSSQPGHYPPSPQSPQSPQHPPPPPQAPQYQASQYAPPAPVYGAAPQFGPGTWPEPPAHPRPPREPLSKLDIAVGSSLFGAVAVALAGSFQTAYKVVYQDSAAPDTPNSGYRATNWLYQVGQFDVHMDTRVLASGFALAVACAVALFAGLPLLAGAGRRSKTVRGFGAVAAGLLVGVGLDGVLSVWDTMRLSEGQEGLKSWQVGPGFWLTLASVGPAVAALLLSVLSLRAPRQPRAFPWQPAGPSGYGPGYAAPPVYAPAPPVQPPPPVQYAPQAWGTPQGQYPAQQQAPVPPPPPVSPPVTTPPPTIPEQPAFGQPQPQPVAQPGRPPADPPPTIPEQPAANLADSMPTVTVRTLPAPPAPPTAPERTDPVPKPAEPVSPAQTAVLPSQSDAVPPQSDAVPPQVDAVPPQTGAAPPTAPEPPADQQTHISRIPVDPLPSPAQISEQASDS